MFGHADSIVQLLLDFHRRSSNYLHTNSSDNLDSTPVGCTVDYNRNDEASEEERSTMDRRADRTRRALMQEGDRPFD